MYSAAARRWPAALMVTVLAVAALAGTLVPSGPPPARAADQAAPPTAAALAWRLRCLARAGAERWQAAGFKGKGVKVAVLDTGFRGWRDHTGRSLPSDVVTRSFRADGNLEARDSQHGILCAEVVHALAPDAGILLANWEPDSPQSFLDAIHWAREQGARVMTCSVIMPSWSDGDGGGPVHAALAEALGAGDRPGDALCFASAGNIARRHWSGPFRDGGDGLHAWRPGVTDNGLAPWGDERVSVEVCWRGAANYDVSVHDRATGEVIVRSEAKPGEERSCAVARFQPDPARSYAVRVRKTRGEGVPFHVVALHSGLEHADARGSICFPADGPAVLAVGAVDEAGRRMTYSSCGPIAACAKPDLVAAVPFPSLWRERPFAGTSAAAPQAAGLAALLWSRHPDWTAARVRAALRAAAVDLGPPGHDVETGYGLVRLPEGDAK